MSSQNMIAIDLECGELKVFEPHPTISVEPGKMTPAGLVEPIIVVRFPTSKKCDLVIQFVPGDTHEPLRVAQLLVEAIGHLNEEKLKCPFKKS